VGKRGLTLVELLIVIALATIIVGAVSTVFKEGINAFRIGENEIFLQRQTQRIMEEMIEGTETGIGIREALEVIEATETSLGFVPLWVDLYPNYYKEKKQEFVLTKKFKPGGSVPIGQIRTPESKRFVSVPVVFIYGGENSNNIVKFINPIPKGSDVRILYYPDPTEDEEVIMRYFWDKKLKRIFRTYKGKTEDIIKRDKKIKIVDFEFSYYDNLNNRIVPVYGYEQERETVVVEESKRRTLSAVGIRFVAERDMAKRELSSFVSVRALGGNLGTGIALGEGTEIKISDSHDIRTLVLDNLAGIEDKDKLEIEIFSARRTWKISIEFGIIDNQPYIIGYNVEYPKGEIVYSNKRKRPAREGLNLLKLGNDYYDYDDDKNVEDVVNMEGEVIFKVTKMDIESAAVFVRP
jgi:prepilin-type N-terminal cleavage/methylation domain-containing protein